MSNESIDSIKIHPETHYEWKYLKSFISGGIAGICAKTMIAPFERIKIIFQATTRRFTIQAALNEAKKLYKTQGLLAFWRGNSANIIRVFPYAAIIFYNSNYSKKKLNFFNFISGALAGIISTSATYPLELIRTRMAVEIASAKPIALRAVMTNIYKTEGFHGYYHGLLPSLAGIIPYHGTGFFIFHMLKGILQERNSKWKQSKLFDFLFGALSGICGQIVAYPFDVVRRRMQAQTYLVSQGEVDKIRNEGITRGFYKGISVNVIKGPLAVGTSFMVKNFVNRNLDKHFSL